MITLQRHALLDAIRAEIADTKARAAYASQAQFAVLRVTLDALKRWEAEEAAKVSA